jgi:hypothetical protein
LGRISENSWEEGTLVGGGGEVYHMASTALHEMAYAKEATVALMI